MSDFQYKIDIDTKEAESELTGFASKLAKAFSEIDIDNLERALKDVTKLLRALESEFKSIGKGSDIGRLGKDLDGVEKDLREATKEAKDFDAALKGIDKDVKVDIDTKGIDKATTAAQSKISALGVGAGAAIGGLAANAASNIISGLAGIITDAFDEFNALDVATRSMATLGAEAKALAPQLKEVSITMSKDLPFAASALQSSFTNAIASGVQGGAKELQAFVDTAAKLAVGGMTDIENAGAGLAATLNAFGASATESAEYADTLFNTVNYGVVSIEELNQYLSQVTPTASSAGLALEDVGAAVALLTQKGIPAAQATTKLNALLVELQKPGSDLKKIFDKGGLSVEALGQELRDGDLPTALEMVQEAFKKTGVSATKAFSSQESSAAFNVLTAKAGEFAATLNGVANDAGSAENAFKEMSGSFENQMAMLKNSVNAVFSDIFTKIAPLLNRVIEGVVSALSSDQFQEIAGAIQDAVEGIITLIADVASTMQPVFAFLGNAFVNIVKSLVSLKPVIAAAVIAWTAYIAIQKAVAIASATNPFTAIIAAAGILLTVFAGLSKSYGQLLEEQKKQNSAEIENIKTKKDLNAQQQTDEQNKQLLIKSYEELGKKANRTKEEEDKYKQTIDKINKAYPGVIQKGDTYEQVLLKTSEKAKLSTEKLQELRKEFAKLDQQEFNLGVENLDIDVKASTQKVRDALFAAFEDLGGVIIDPSKAVDYNKLYPQLEKQLLRVRGASEETLKDIDAQINAVIKKSSNISDKEAQAIKISTAELLNTQRKVLAAYKARRDAAEEAGKTPEIEAPKEEPKAPPAEKAKAKELESLARQIEAVGFELSALYGEITASTRSEFDNQVQIIEDNLEKEKSAIENSIADIRKEVAKGSESKYNAAEARQLIDAYYQKITLIEEKALQAKNKLIEDKDKQSKDKLREQAIAEASKTLAVLTAAEERYMQDAEKRSKAFSNTILGNIIAINEEQTALKDALLDATEAQYDALNEGNMDAYDQLESRIDEILKKVKNLADLTTAEWSKISLTLGQQFGETFATIMVETGNIKKAAISALLDTVEATFPLLLAQIVAWTAANPLQGLFAGVAYGALYGTFKALRAKYGYAEGGLITGEGSGTSDSIPIFASNGEFMVNARQTSKNRALLEMINKGSGDILNNILSYNNDNGGVVSELRRNRNEIALLRGDMNKLKMVTQYQNFEQKTTVNNVNYKAGRLYR